MDFIFEDNIEPIDEMLSVVSYSIVEQYTDIKVIDFLIGIQYVNKQSLQQELFL